MRAVFLIVLLFFASLSYGQFPGNGAPQGRTTGGESGGPIIDDSTKNVYGAFSTEYFYESALKNNTWDIRRNPRT